MRYLKRDISEIFLSKIGKGGVVTLTGSRQTGKTTLCEEIIPPLAGLSHTYISFDDPDERLRFQNSAITILESIETPLVILDEVQKMPSLFDPLKYVVDKEKKKAGEEKIFILTGSSQLLMMTKIRESLAGRVTLLHLFPFSLSEVVETGNPLLLTKIWKKRGIDKNDIAYFRTIKPEKMRAVLKTLKEHQIWGGYPPVWQSRGEEEKTDWLKDFRMAYIERDISDVGAVANMDTFILAQKILCARTGQILSFSEVARDLSLAVNTVKRYINLLTMTFQSFLLPPYYENIGKRFIKSPKIYFPDAGLNRVILGEMSVSSGASYESWVFSELVKWKQLQPIEPELYFYRTAAGMEIDFLLVSKGRILPVEVKSSAKVTYEDARTLESFMKEHKKAAPSGIVIYKGKEIVEIRKNIWAVPDWALLGGC